MRALPLMAAAALLLAGCAATPDDSELRNRYGASLVESVELPESLFGGMEGQVNMTRILGEQVLVKVAGGEFAPTASTTLEGGAIQGPATTTGPTGGGGESTPLPAMPKVAIEAKLADPSKAEGLTVAWMLVADAAKADPVSAPFARLEPGATFTAELAQPRLYHVGAFLLASPDDPVREAVAFLAEAAPVAVKAHYTITGEVHPVHPNPGLPVALPTTSDRAQMVDLYTFEAIAGLIVTATTSFNGGQGDGTDVDLGLYAPDGEGVACVGSGGGGSIGPDPAQAGEALEAATDASGSWSVQVGAMADGCGGTGSWTYNNAAAVPYKLDILLG